MIAVSGDGFKGSLGGVGVKPFTLTYRSTTALVPSFGSIGTILPPRPARAWCRRAQWRSRMARLRATASAARSVLDCREHDGRLDRVGGLTPHTPDLGQKPTSSSKSVHMLTCRISTRIPDVRKTRRLRAAVRFPASRAQGGADDRMHGRALC
jgi:hypothetical protein